LQMLYKKYYKKMNRGFTAAEFQKELEIIIGEKMDTFFADYIYGTKVPDYAKIFAPVGLEVTYTGESKPSFGTSLTSSGNSASIRSIRSESAAENAGLSVGDEIIGLNGYRTSQKSLEDFLDSASEGTSFELLISRDEIISTIPVTMASYERPQYALKAIDSAETNALKTFWLR
jgi:predicted metalloprotease with PDZ domain